VVLAPLGVYRARVRAAAWWLAAAVVALSLLGVVLKALPGFDQDNLFVIALVLPGQLVLAWVLMRFARASAPRATSS
jgi:hypothetical protein